MKIDINKKYRYRNGESARILCVDAPGDQPVISLDGSGDTLAHNAAGQFFLYNEESSLDLIEVREPLECWVCVHVDERGITYGCGYEKEPAGPHQYRKFREIID